MQETKYQPRELADKIITLLDQHKAGGIKLLYTEEKTTLADYFIICSGNSGTQTRGLADEVEYKMGLEGVFPGFIPKGMKALLGCLWITEVLLFISLTPKQGAFITLRSFGMNRKRWIYRGFSPKIK